MLMVQVASLDQHPQQKSLLDDKDDDWRGHVLPADVVSSSAQDDTVAFMVELSSDRKSDHDSILVFDDVQVDTTNSYIPAVGLYVCPSDGWYLFMWSLQAVHGRVSAKLVIDDTDVKVGPLTQESPNDNHSGSSSMSAVAFCAAGSAVWLKVVTWPDENTANIFQAKYTSFLGTRLYASREVKNQGNVLIPSAFMVELQTNTSYNSGGAIIEYDNVLLDVRGDYDADFGVFTCPQNGSYMFSDSAHDEHGDEGLMLVINGDTEYVGPYMLNTFYPTDSGTSSMNFILDLLAGDRVHVATYYSKADLLSVYSSFAGILLPETESFVAFHAMLNSWEYLGDGRTIVFDKVLTNIGGHYFPIDGLFVCPDDAFYLFTWSFLTDDYDDQKR